MSVQSHLASRECRSADGSEFAFDGRMATTRKTKTAKSGSRMRELRQILEERRDDLVREVQEKIREARADVTRERQMLDANTEIGLQEDIEFTLIQMKAGTLSKIEAALRRFDEDTYGLCDECGADIAERRLRALPFAVRCKDCEEAREMAEAYQRNIARRGSASAAAGM